MANGDDDVDDDGETDVLIAAYGRQTNQLYRASRSGGALRFEELGAASRPRLLVYNKCDLPGAAEPPPAALAVSAHTGEGIEALLLAFDGAFAPAEEKISILIPHGDGRTRAWLHRHGRVVEEAVEEGGTRVVAWLGARAAGQLRQQVEADGYDLRTA